MLPRVEVVEMLGLAGFDVAVLDLEHGPMGVPDLPALAAACRGAGVYSVARLIDGSGSTIASALDTGVDGVLVPHVDSRAQAHAVVRAGRYPPLGERSLNPYVRGTRYGADEGNVRDAANARVAIMAMLEGEDAVADVDGICQVDGIDAVFIGPVDLSAALGVPGEPEHPRVVEEVTKLFRRLEEAGVAGGIYAPTAEAARRWLDAGAAVVAVSADSAVVLGAFRALHRDVRD